MWYFLVRKNTFLIFIGKDLSKLILGSTKSYFSLDYQQIDSAVSNSIHIWQKVKVSCSARRVFHFLPLFSRQTKSSFIYGWMNERTTRAWNLSDWENLLFWMLMMHLTHDSGVTPGPSWVNLMQLENSFLVIKLEVLSRQNVDHLLNERAKRYNLFQFYEDAVFQVRYQIIHWSG